ncbi:hypothetical protein [Clostridium sp. AN503]|uniref:hypothetical protein n=1 Tax=Clostridium sp. AN503 TaxID=3160598 RepID=UPI0034598204
MLGFKALLQRDVKRVFLNPEEFGEEHLVGNRKMTIIIDDIEMIEREKRQKGQQEYRQGIYKKQVLFYVSGQEFGRLPALGRSLELDGKAYIITDAVDEAGIYSISLEAVRS